jgi:tRNA(fMet)-specific endonuclease VapC
VIYLLDSNVWITFLRKPHSLVVPRLKARQPSEIRVCSVVVAELYLGCLRSAKSLANRAQVEALLRPYGSLPFDDSAAGPFAWLRHHLESRAEFMRVPGLLLEDWEKP